MLLAVRKPLNISPFPPPARPERLAIGNCCERNKALSSRGPLINGPSISVCKIWLYPPPSPPYNDRAFAIPSSPIGVFLVSRFALAGGWVRGDVRRLVWRIRPGRAFFAQVSCHAPYTRLQPRFLCPDRGSQRLDYSVWKKKQKKNGRPREPLLRILIYYYCITSAFGCWFYCKYLRRF